MFHGCFDEIIVDAWGGWRYEAKMKKAKAKVKAEGCRRRKEGAGAAGRTKRGRSVKSEPPVGKVRFCNDKRKCFFAWQERCGAHARKVFNARRCCLRDYKVQERLRAVVLQQ